MKKIILTAVAVIGLTATAQVKVGADVLNLATGANFQVEGDSSNQLVVMKATGNVGIGTTTPYSKLQVINGRIQGHIRTYAATSYFDEAFTNANELGGADGFLYGTYSTNVAGVFPFNTSGTGEVVLQGTARSGYAGGISFATGFGTSQAVGMRVTSNGNVGIGTTTPNEKLQVLGNTNLGNVTNLQAAVSYKLAVEENMIIKGTAANIPLLNLSHYTNTTDSGAALQDLILAINPAKDGGSGVLYTSVPGTSYKPLYIQGSKTVFEIGDVGIGQSFPSAKLEVNGNVKIATTPTITTATKVLVKNPATTEISEQDISLGNVPTLDATAVNAIAGEQTVFVPGGGYIVTSPDGATKWRISVSNTGVLSTKKIN